MAIVVILPIAALISVLFGKKIDDTLALAASFSLLGLFLGGMIFPFSVCIYLIVLLSIVSFVCLIIYNIKNHTTNLKLLLTPGMFFLAVFMAYSMLSSEGRYFAYQDEYSAWAVGCKFMYLYDHYIVNGLPLYSCYNHMPASRLWGLFSTRIWFRYAEGILIFGQSMLCIAFMLPFLDRFNFRKKTGCAIATMLFLAFFPRIGRGVAFDYMNIMIDALLAIVNIYVCLMFRRFLRTRSRFYSLSVLIGLAMSVLTKESGFFIALIEVFVMFCVLINEQKRDNYWTDRRIVGFICIQVLAPFFVIAAWKLYLSMQGEGSIRRMEAFIALFERIHPIVILCVGVIFCAIVFFFVRSFIRTGNSKWIIIPALTGYVVMCVACVVIGNQSQDVFLSQVNSFIQLLLANTLVGHWMPMSLLMFMTAVIAIDVALRYLRGNRDLSWLWLVSVFIMTVLSYTVSLLITDEFRWINNTIIAVECVIWMAIASRLYRVAEEGSRLGNTTNSDLLRYLLYGHLMYLAFLFVSYSVGFSDYEASIAASADRYETTFLLLILGVFLDIWLDTDGVGVLANTNVVAIVVSCIVMNMGVLGGITQLWDKPEEDVFYGLENVELSFDDTICYVDVRDHYGPDWLYRFLYANYPVQVVTGPSWTWYEEDNLYTTRVSIDAIQDYLQDTDCDYVYIQNTDEGFKEFYAELFENAEDIENNRLYRIVEDGEGIQLEFVP